MLSCGVQHWKVRIGIAVLIAAAAAGFGLRAKGEMLDFGVYLTAGARVAAGENLYRVEDGHWQYKYLPAFAFVIAPLSALPPVAARAVWFALSLGLLVAFVRLSWTLLPDRRRVARVVVGITVVAMAKFYVRELGLGQTNILLAVLALWALSASARGRESLSGVLLGVATLVKPYAILFWPWLVWRRRYQAAAWFAAAVALGVALPVVRYGVGGTIDLMFGLWSVVTTSTAPNLAGQDNASIAGMYASWVGVGWQASQLTLVFTVGVLINVVWLFRRPTPSMQPAYLETGVILLLIPLLSPQGWDYVFLMGTPVVMLLVDRTDLKQLPQGPLLGACLVLVGLSIWDVMGRDLYRSFMMARVVTVCVLVELAMALHLRQRGLA